MDTFKQILGRLHPLIVHLPIGFIMLGILLLWYDRKKSELNKIIGIIFLWAGFSAVVACVTGYLQYQEEGYSYDSVKWHLWSAIATTTVCFMFWIRLNVKQQTGHYSKIPLGIFSVCIFLLVSLTGHKGGNLTHGEDYLIAPLPNSLKSALGYEIVEEKKIIISESNWQDVTLFPDMVTPILDKYCVSCHNLDKNKGNLILIAKDMILEGGDNGPVVIAGSPDDSELYKRMLLPKHHDKHMPPDGKNQPSKEEILLIKVWIEHGLNTRQTVGEMGLDKSLFTSFFPKIAEKNHPGLEVAQAHTDSIFKVKKTGFLVEPISKSTNFLSVSALHLPNFEDAQFKSLLPIKDHIAELDLGRTRITNSIFKQLSSLPNLTILKLDNTQLTGEHINVLQNLKYLKSINLSLTNFNAGNLKKLEQFKQLKKVFLFNPESGKTGTEFLGNTHILVEYGNYKLPALKSDSLVY